MKSRLFHILTFLTAATAASSASAAAPKLNFEFAENSILESGKWVKISIDETGVYEIGYDELKAMGFDNPEDVALYGTGGALLPFNFIDNDGIAQYDDSLQPVAVMHTGNKMIFYGNGTETMSATTIGFSSKRFRHRRVTKNIYSDRSYYLLTDSQAPLEPAPNPVSNKANAVEMPTGYAYIYHEKDLRHNEHMEGQVFWGEEAYYGKPVSFSVERPYCLDLPAHVWLEYANMYENGGTVECTFGGTTTTALINNMPSNVYTLGTTSQNVKMNVDANGRGTGLLTIGITDSYPATVPLAIDYWTITYPISLAIAKNDPGFTSQYIAFMESSSSVWKHPVPENSVAWDVTGNRLPKKLDIEDGYLYNNVRYLTQLVVFNPDKEQLHINSDWEAIPNSNLHALQQEPVSMVIFTTETLRPYAERIAALHEKYCGQKVVTLVPDEVYNEFNHGTPDVTALRAFVKMLYQKQPATMKNVLILGNIYADYRNVDGHPDRAMGLPVYMIPKINLKRAEGAEGAAAPDYLGVMTDYMNATGMLGNVAQEVGVGILPVSSFEEAEIVVKKINDYLEKEDFSNLVNEFLTISDSGDSHIHDFQAFRMANMLRQYASDNFGTDYAVSPLWSESMGFEKARQELLASIRRGKLLCTYYGHAGEPGFGSVTSQDMMTLDNEEPSFFFMAACDLCAPDRMHHGIGDLGVIRNTRGLIATVCATRSVLSHENQALAENFITSIFFDKNDACRTSTPTIGEIYALARARTTNVSKQGYLMIGDPGLPFPVALGKATVTTDRSDYRGGEIMEISGEIKTASGERDETFNGFATIKVMEPATEQAIVGDPVDEDGEVKPNPRLKINDYRLATVRTEVKNGKYKGRVTLPGRTDSFLSTPDSTRSLTVMVGAYNPATRSASSGVCKVDMPQLTSEPDPGALRDTQAPQLSMSHDPLMRSLTLTASDDTGLNPGIGGSASIRLSIDGDEKSATSGYPMATTVESFSTIFSTAKLSAGKHTAIATVTDVAGNTSSAKKLEFEVAATAPIGLSAGTGVVTESLSLSADGQTAGNLSILITDSEGRIVITDTLNGNSAEIDVADLPAGSYFAAVREESPKGASIYSNWVEFIKLD